MTKQLAKSQSERAGEPSRRKFLSRALAGGLAGACMARNEARGETAQAAPPAAPRPGLLCGVRLSPSEALDRHVLMLLKAQNEVYRSLTAELIAKSGECSNVLLRLGNLVRKLRQQLAQFPPLKGQAGAMGELVSMARAQVALTKVSAETTGEAAASLAGTLGGARRGVTRLAQDMLPQDLSGLSSAAVATLNNILREIQAAEPLQKELGRIQSKVDKEFGTFSALSQSLKYRLEDASTFSVEADDPLVTPAARGTARAAALSELDEALTVIKKLKGNNSHTEVSADIVRVLEVLVGGTRTWIENGSEAPPTAQHGSDAAPAGVAFVKASAGGSRAFRLDPWDRPAVSRLFDEHCKPGSALKVSDFYTYSMAPTMNSVWLWKKLGRPYTEDGLKDVLLGSLKYREVKCKGRETAPNYGSLAATLANAIFNYYS